MIPTGERRQVRRQLLVSVLTLLAAPFVAGCRGTPLFNIMGSFFPAWMVCFLLGLLFTLLVRWIFQRSGFERNVRPLIVVYPALLTLFTCAIWLVFFS